MQHFISTSSWDDRALLGPLTNDTDNLLGGAIQSALLVDETCFAKQSKSSVELQRQGCFVQVQGTNRKASRGVRAYRQHQRYWIEDHFKRCKENLRMTDCQSSQMDWLVSSPVTDLLRQLLFSTPTSSF